VVIRYTHYICIYISALDHISEFNLNALSTFYNV
jgi:hypothetical protein